MNALEEIQQYTQEVEALLTYTQALQELVQVQSKRIEKLQADNKELQDQLAQWPTPPAHAFYDAQGNLWEPNPDGLYASRYKYPRTFPQIATRYGYLGKLPTKSLHATINAISDALQRSKLSLDRTSKRIKDLRDKD